MISTNKEILYRSGQGIIAGSVCLKRNRIIQGILWLLEGVIVGFGAIMPGISGGALCVAFGMYKPLIGILSDPKNSIKKHWKMLGVFLLGGVIGFIGLSGVADWLMLRNSQAVTCAFIGFIIGTVPGLWSDAGKQGRKSSSYVALIVGFAAMLGLLWLLKSQSAITFQANIWGYLFCGIMWGLSLVIPGLSSSTLLLFFGLYQPMLDGIVKFSPEVLIPLAIGVVICLLTLPKGVDAAYKRFYSVISHSILGIVAATTVMIIPSFHTETTNILLYIACIVGGSVVSYFLSNACERLKNRSES